MWFFFNVKSRIYCPWKKVLFRKPQSVTESVIGPTTFSVSYIIFSNRWSLNGTLHKTCSRNCFGLIQRSNNWVPRENTCHKSCSLNQRQNKIWRLISYVVFKGHQSHLQRKHRNCRLLNWSLSTQQTSVTAKAVKGLKEEFDIQSLRQYTIPSLVFRVQFSAWEILVEPANHHEQIDTKKSKTWQNQQELTSSKIPVFM